MSANGNLATNLKDKVTDHFLPAARARTDQSHWRDLALAVVGTLVIAFIVKAVVGLRPSEEVETVGLDLSEHGEEGYHAEAVIAG